MVTQKESMVGSYGRGVNLCKSSSPLFFLLPSISGSSTRPRFDFFSPYSSSPVRRVRVLAMSSAASSSSSSSSSISSGDAHKPPLSPANGLTSSSPPSSSSAIDFLSLCHRLKTTKRAGWIRKEIKDPESVADHMYRMGLMALIATDVPGVDRDKCIKMAIVHDIAEAIVGDITPSDGIPKSEKSRREREALDHMCKLLGGEARANEIHNLWMEYEENCTPEAKIVKDLDKVEMILQALEYENEQGKNLEEFFQSTAACLAFSTQPSSSLSLYARKFQTELGKAWASEVASRRRSKNPPLE